MSIFRHKNEFSQSILEKTMSSFKREREQHTAVRQNKIRIKCDIHVGTAIQEN